MFFYELFLFYLDKFKQINLTNLKSIKNTTACHSTQHEIMVIQILNLIMKKNVQINWILPAYCHEIIII